MFLFSHAKRSCEKNENLHHTKISSYTVSFFLYNIGKCMHIYFPTNPTNIESCMNIYNVMYNYTNIESVELTVYPYSNKLTI